MSAKEAKSDQHIKVYVRERPRTKDEIELNHSRIVTDISSNQLFLKAGNQEKNYTFDHVFHPASTQQEVYNMVVKPLLEYSLTGYTCTVFAYGQTGTGKTYTMLGHDVSDLDQVNSEGMMPRASTQLFQELAKLKAGFRVTISFIEIYNEEVRDLLVSEGTILKLYDDPINRGSTCIKGVSEVEVSSWKEVYDLLLIGQTERQTASTKLNRQSSRSHTIFTINITIEETSSSGEAIIKTGKLHLIDLAGSENIGRSGATEMRAREAGNINKSLLTLGKVIKALARKMAHVPYRESKLTRILQDSLGGKSRTCIIATFAPCADAFDETISTLDYAQMARHVTNTPQKNVRVSRNDFQDVQRRIHLMRMDLAAARTSEGFYMNRDSYARMSDELKQQSDRMTGLHTEIENLAANCTKKMQEMKQLHERYTEVKRKAEEVETVLKARTEQREQKRILVENVHKNVQEMRETATGLLDVCETSTRNQDVYYNKYDTQCQGVLHNANIVSSIHSTGYGCLKEMQHASTTFADNIIANLSLATAATSECKTTETDVGEILNKLSLQLQSNLNDSCTFESLFRNGEYHRDNIKNVIVKCRRETLREQMDQWKSLQSLLLAGKEAIEAKSKEFAEKTVDDLRSINKELETQKDVVSRKKKDLMAMEDNCDSRIRSCLEEQRLIKDEKSALQQILKVRTARNELLALKLSQSKREQTLIDTLIDSLRDDNTMLKVSDVMKSLRGMIEATKSMSDDPKLNIKINETPTLMYETARTRECETHSYLGEVYRALKDGCKTRNQEINSCVETCGAALQEVKNQLEDVCVSNCQIVDNQTKLMIDQSNIHESDLRQFVQSSKENISNYVNDIDFTVHAGDTPVKAEFKSLKIRSNSIPKQYEKQN